MKYVSHSPAETKAIAANILNNLSTNVIALHGPLGAGKTVFAQGMAQALGVTQRVISPTFVLMRHYPIADSKHIYNSIYHLDLYRVDSAADLRSVELKEIIADPQNLIIIEWAEKTGLKLPVKPLKITLSGENHTRTIEIANS
ncbi:MAG: tRNA (adenosine(37)-N6)-threonylcarbamoyltransferase complex ATPase subunit type 1 TsaE [Candidatus Chisholmbacteria bacterium]|nr:tRNA (adenosine(37)-N6)-threonylcarbamoyltransferase complex ATPase subunit type 1 TsaE [Candidatus Chisholmbacteria bacterium]